MIGERRGRVLRFDEAFDGGAWPGPLRADAAFGQMWLGPAGLLATLETDLGLSGEHASNEERIASVYASLRRADGRWRRSFEADGLGTARRLLRDRDALSMAGWREQPLSPRLEELAAATAAAPAGIPDRLRAATEALTSRPVDIAALELLEPPGALPLAWQQVIAALSRRGVAIETRPLEPHPARGDLAAARESVFEPRRDGSLQLIRPYGPLAAADEVAAWLAARDDLSGCAIIGADDLLDRALERHGLPATGAPRGEDADTDMLSLAVELGWAPADPAIAFELLSAPDGPIPRHVARGLLRALQETPAVDSDAWRERLSAGLDAIDDEGRRARVARRIATLFRPAARRKERYPAGELRDRARALADWAAAREAEPAGFARMTAHARAFERLLDLTGLDSMEEAEISRWLRLAAAAVGSAKGAAAGAGIGAVRRPDAIAGPARRIIWWNFERGAAMEPETIPLCNEERGALADLGVDLPEPGARAEMLARRWSRPLAQAGDALVLVCPAHGDDGEALSPHPLWDEIAARARAPDRRRGAGALVRPRPDLPAPAPRVRSSPRALPAAQRIWTAPPAAVGLRERESPSGLAALLGCSLKWTLTYHGGLRGGLGRAPEPVGPNLFGDLAHAVLERLASEPPRAPEDAARRAQAAFADLVPRSAGALELPGYEAERAALRQHIERAARAVFQLVADLGLEVRSAETSYARAAFGTELEGRPDLVLAPPALAPPELVLDLKYGSADRHARALRQGTALQLAAYSYLVAEGPAWPRTAYFVVRTRQLLDRADVAPARTWRAAEAAAEIRAAELERGELVAEAVAGHGADIPADDALEDGTLRIAPPCRICEFGALCGADPGGEP